MASPAAMLLITTVFAPNLTAAESPPAQQKSNVTSTANKPDTHIAAAKLHELTDARSQKRALARGILVAAYKNSFTISTLPDAEVSPNERRLVNRALAAEMSKLLADIKNLNAAIVAHNPVGSGEIGPPKNDATLDTLVAKLDPSASTIAEMPRQFDDNKKFPWPITGDISSTPGSALREGGAKWPGILIQAEPGAKVKSIAPGKVVYAGEMKNLGLLIIVNHQDGHLSLYGKNAQIFVAQGEEVRKNQTIAIIESNPNSTEVGLYFEIRRNGQPVGPRLLCSNALGQQL